jgi:hypothetical protein
VIQDVEKGNYVGLSGGPNVITKGPYVEEQGQGTFEDAVMLSLKMEGWTLGDLV